MDDLAGIPVPDDMSFHTSSTKVRVEHGKVVLESTWEGEDTPAMFIYLSPESAFIIASQMISAAQGLKS